jgi:hypothetical protein
MQSVAAVASFKGNINHVPLMLMSPQVNVPYARSTGSIPSALSNLANMVFEVTLLHASRRITTFRQFTFSITYSI